jgi:DNA polymerase I
MLQNHGHTTTLQKAYSMNDKVIVVDCNAVCHRVKHTMKDLTYHEKKTGVIFGFLDYVLRFAKRYNTKHFVFCWDSGKSHRLNIFPQYKEKRRNHKKECTPEERELNMIAYDQFNILRTVTLKYLGFQNLLIQTGREADDLVATSVATLFFKHDYKADQIIVVSADEDMFQLLEHCTYAPLYGGKKGKKKEYTKMDFQDEYGIAPSDWNMVKAIAGCTSDEIPGIPNVKEDRAIKYLTHVLTKGKIYDAIYNGHEIINRNLKLVTLPFEGTRFFPIKFDDKHSLQKFYDVCDDYGFSSFTRGVKHEEWIKCFDMK